MGDEDVLGVGGWFGAGPKRKKDKQEYGPFSGAFGLGEEPKPAFRAKGFAKAKPVQSKKYQKDKSIDFIKGAYRGAKDVYGGAKKTYGLGKRIYRKRKIKKYLDTRTTQEVRKLRATDKQGKKLLRGEKVRRRIISQHRALGEDLGFEVGE